MVGMVINLNLLIALAVAVVYGAIAAAIGRALRRRRATELTYAGRGLVRTGS